MGKDEQEIGDVLESQRLQWQRLVEDNHELLTALGRIRGEHGLSMRSARQAMEWMDRCPDDCNKVHEQVLALAIQYGIPERWHTNLYFCVYTGSLYTVPVAFSMGLPGLHSYLGPDGKVKTDTTLEPHTLMANTYAIEAFRHEQLRKDPPPQPQQQGRKKDWQPVYEWHLRHPEVSQKELAHMLGKDYDRVRRKLRECGAK